MIAGLIFFAISAMLFIFAYLLYYKEAYWLISGINFQSREQAQYDCTERYMRVGKKSQRIVNLFVTVLLAAVAVFVIAMMVTGSKAPEISVEKGELIIESSYGTKLPLDQIEQIGMVDLKGRENPAIPF